VRGRRGEAARGYDLVSTTDPACTTASAGLGRMRAATGDRAGAVSAFGRIPPTSAAWSAGQVAAVRALISASAGTGSKATSADLVRAAELIDSLGLPPATAATLRICLPGQALEAAQAGQPLPAAVLGESAVAAAALDGGALERRVRLALEREYRVLARASDGLDRIRLVDLANEVRPRTLT